MRSFLACVALASCTLLRPSSAAQAPVITADGDDLTVSAPGGEITFKTNAGDIAISAIVTSKSKLEADVLGLQQLVGDASEYTWPAKTKTVGAAIELLTSDLAGLVSDLTAKGEATDGVVKGLRGDIDKVMAAANTNTQNGAEQGAKLRKLEVAQEGQQKDVAAYKVAQEAEDKETADGLKEYTSTVQDTAEANAKEIKLLKEYVASLARNVTKNTDASGSTGGSGGVARSCLDLKEQGQTRSGTHTINPDGNGVVDVFCDMKEGLTLVGMVHTSNKLDVGEPNDWFAKSVSGGDKLLATNTNKHDTSPVAVGAGRFAQYIRDQVTAGKKGSTPFIKVVVHAHDDLSQTNQWYKDLAKPETFTTLFQDNQAYATRTCRNVGMTDDCVAGSYIGKPRGGQMTVLFGMRIKVGGRVLGGQLHMRMDNDQNSASSGVCSSTTNSRLWKDSAKGANGNEGHWGNALRIWLH